MSNASWVLALVSGGATTFCPTDVLEAFYLRLGVSVFLFALGLALGIAGLWLSRGRRKSAWIGFATNVLGLLLSGAYYHALFTHYRSQGWI